MYSPCVATCDVCVTRCGPDPAIWWLNLWCASVQCLLYFNHAQVSWSLDVRRDSHQQLWSPGVFGQIRYRQWCWRSVIDANEHFSFSWMTSTQLTCAKKCQHCWGTEAEWRWASVLQLPRVCRFQKSKLGAQLGGLITCTIIRSYFYLELFERTLRGKIKV